MATEASATNRHGDERNADEGVGEEQAEQQSSGGERSARSRLCGCAGGRSYDRPNSIQARVASAEAIDIVRDDTRTTTDIVFLLLFAAAWIGMFIIGERALSQGSIPFIRNGIDSQGFLCGADNSADLYTDGRNELLEITRDLRRNQSIPYPDLSSRSVQYYYNPLEYPNFANVGGKEFPESVCLEECPKFSVADVNLTYDQVQNARASLDVGTPSRSQGEALGLFYLLNPRELRGPGEGNCSAIREKFAEESGIAIPNGDINKCNNDSVEACYEPPSNNGTNDESCVCNADQCQGIDNLSTSERDQVSSNVTTLPDEFRELDFLFSPNLDILSPAVVCTYYVYSSKYGQFEGVDDFDTRYFDKFTLEEQLDSLQNVSPENDCFPVLLGYQNIFQRCVPFLDNKTLTKFRNNPNSNSTGVSVEDLEAFKAVQDQIGQYISDIVNAWPLVLIAGVLVAMVIAPGWIIMLYFTAKASVWGTIALLNLLLLIITLLFLVWGGLIPESGPFPDDPMSQLPAKARPEDFNPEAYYSYIAYGFIGILVISVVVTLLFIRRIKTAIAMLRVASEAVRLMPSTAFLPIINLFLTIAQLVWFVVIGTYIAASGTIDDQCDTVENDEGESEVQCNFNRNFSKRIQYAGIYHVFVSLLWTMNWIGAISAIVISGAAGTMYFASGKSSRMPAGTFWRSLYNAYRFHIGSAALGSLLMSVLQFLSWFMRYLRFGGGASKNDNCCKRFVLRGLRALTYLAEIVVKYASKMAFIMIGISGKSYCPAAEHAFQIVLESANQAASMSAIGAIVLTLGKLMVACISLVVAFLLSDATIFSDPKSDYYMASPIAPMCVSLYLSPTIVLFLSLSFTEIAVLADFSPPFVLQDHERDSVVYRRWRLFLGVRERDGHDPGIAPS